jgi:hypothetical protein
MQRKTLCVPEYNSAGPTSRRQYTILGKSAQIGGNPGDLSHWRSSAMAGDRRDFIPAEALGDACTRSVQIAQPHVRKCKKGHVR